MVAEETLNAFQRPDLLGEICAYVAEGGNLVAFCKAQSPALVYKLVNRWITDDTARAEKYKLALDIRESHAKDLILGQLISWTRAKPLDAFEFVDGVATDEAGRQRFKPLQDWPADLQALVAGIEFEELFEWQGRGKDRERVHIGRIHKIKFYDKPKSIETFMKHLQMLIERKDIRLTASLADLIAPEPPKVAAGS